MNGGTGGRELVRVGLSGAGFMGRALLHQCAITPGVCCVALANRTVERAVAAARDENLGYRVVEDASDLSRAVEAGELAIVQDVRCLAECEQIDVILEATSSIAPAGLAAQAALARGKHVVMMNAEADLAFGPYLLAVARREGVVYTSADGDQHTVLKRLADELVLSRMEVALAGNIKGFLDRYATSTSIASEAAKRGLSPRMTAALTDGTKLNVEMALLANGMGLRTVVPGMYGPRAGRVEEALRLFDPRELGVEDGGVVDYLLGAEPGGGVFIVARCEDGFQRGKLAYYKLGPGPYYLFWRHFHLCHMEALRSVLEAARENKAALQPVYGRRTDVVAYAKRALTAGETLEGVGGETCYGLIENVGEVEASGLPIALAEGVVARRAIARDERIALGDVAYEESREEFRMYGECVSA